MKPARYKQLLLVYKKLAINLAEFGTCERLRVGCVILSQDLTVMYGAGYNGNAKGLKNTCDTSTPGACGDLHAEENALLKVRISDPSKIVIVTTAPCKMCAKRFINSGISKVYYVWGYRNDEGLKILKLAKIPYEQI